MEFVSTAQLQIKRASIFEESVIIRTLQPGIDSESKVRTANLLPYYILEKTEIERASMPAPVKRNKTNLDIIFFYILKMMIVDLQKKSHDLLPNSSGAHKEIFMWRARDPNRPRTKHQTRTTQHRGTTHKHNTQRTQPNPHTHKERDTRNKPHQTHGTGTEHARTPTRNHDFLEVIMQAS